MIAGRFEWAGMLYIWYASVSSKYQTISWQGIRFRGNAKARCPSRPTYGIVDIKYLSTAKCGERINGVHSIKGPGASAFGWFDIYEHRAFTEGIAGDYHLLICRDAVCTLTDTRHLLVQTSIYCVLRALQRTSVRTPRASLARG